MLQSVTQAMQHQNRSVPTPYHELQPGMDSAAQWVHGTVFFVLLLLVWSGSWFDPGFNLSFSVSLRAVSHLKGHSTTYAALEADGRKNASSQASLVLCFLPNDDGDTQQLLVLVPVLLPPHEGCEHGPFWSYKATALVQCFWPGTCIP